MALTKIPASFLDKSSHVDFADNERLRLGTGNDLQIFSDGTNSRIYESGGGLLVIRASNFNINNADGSQSYITMSDGGATTLYYAGAAKLATASGGASVTGNLAVSGNLTVSGTTTELDTTNLNVTDKNITLNYHASSDTSSSADGAGITIQDAVNASTNATLNWSAANDRFVMSHGLQVTSGNVGIGTTSPADRLHVALDSGTTNAEVEVVRIEATSSGTPAVGFGPFIDFRGDRINGGPDSYGRIGFEADAMPSTTVNGAFIAQTAVDGTYSERMRITSAGNVGIGTASPPSPLSIFGTGTSSPTAANAQQSYDNSIFRINNFANSSVGLSIGAAGGNGTYIQTSYNEGTTAPLLINPFGGNLMVGTTSTTVGGLTSAGFGFRVDSDNGILQTASNNNVTAIFNRTNTDGAIVSLRKNGTQNGVLATAGGDLVVGSHNTCFRFDDSADDILPTDDAGLLIDNTLVLGASNARFKEIYLSNGINFSANANASGMSSEILDDYEEGTFDASITPASGSYTLNSGYSKFGYTRIGRVVTITGMVVISATSGASGSVTIGDLPFEMLNATQRSSQTRPSIHIYANGGGAPASGYYPAFIAFNEGNRSGSLIVTYNNTHDGSVGDWLAGGSDIFLNFSYHAA